jgi:hypothetical protein
VSAPVFAVVGHPNKGKSSIVSTLAYDDSVRIAPDPGTTAVCRPFPMTVDGELLYTLVDTPGFQRARRALLWMTERETNAARHPEVVRAFVHAFRNTGEFPDECELLTPLIEGAGILYVVDGSVPYGPEYEAEMKILRWSGQPSMGLINPILSADYVEEWRAALGQYFSVVRVFNAVYSEFGKRIDLLRAFGLLREEWQEPLQRAVASLEADRSARRDRAARVMASTIEARLEEAYRRALQTMEGRCRDRVEEIYDHHALDRKETALPILDEDHLFSRETWRLFGLSNRHLLTVGAVSGGAIGGAVDAASGGASFLLGSLVGAGVGAVTTYLAGDKLGEAKVLHVPLGGRKLVMTPTRNVRFPHVVFSRARLHHALVANRTHALREALRIDEGAANPLRELEASRVRDLERCFRMLRKDPHRSGAADRLYETIRTILEADDRPARKSPQESGGGQGDSG